MHYVKRPDLTNRAMRLSARVRMRACDSNKNSFNRTRAGLLFPLRREGNAHDSREDVVAPSANKRIRSESRSHLVFYYSSLQRLKE